MRELEQYSRAICPWIKMDELEDLLHYHALHKTGDGTLKHLRHCLDIVHAAYSTAKYIRGVLVEREALKGSPYEIGSEEHETIVTKDGHLLEQSINIGIDFGSEQHTVDAFAYQVQAIKKQSLIQLGESLIKAIAGYRRDMAEIHQEELHNQHPELSHLGYYDRFTKL